MIKKILSIVLSLCMLFSVGVVFCKAASVGSVYISFADYGERAVWDNAEDMDYPEALGVIIPETEFQIYENETYAQVLERFFIKNNIQFTYTGTGTTSGSYFYLSSIKNVTMPNGTHLERFGELSSGSWSGWMIKINNAFLTNSISEYTAQDGDIICGLNSCQGGADVGSDWTKASAEIVGLEIDKNYGVLTSEFNNETLNYVLKVPYNVNSVMLSAVMENYSSVVHCTLTSGETKTEYKYRRLIPVKDKDTISFDSSYYSYGSNEATDTDSIVITVEKQTFSEYAAMRINDFFTGIKEFFANIAAFLGGLFN